MSRNYKFHNPGGLYFKNFAVVGWLGVFKAATRKDFSKADDKLIATEEKRDEKCYET